MIELPAELLAADERVLDAAELLIDAFDDYPAAAGLAALERAVDAGRAAAAQCAVRSPAEGLALEHLAAGWTALHEVVRYRFAWPEVPVDVPLDAIAGPDAAARLERTVATIDGAAAWDYLVLRQSFRSARVAPDTAEGHALLVRRVPPLVEAFRGWLAAHDPGLPGLDAEVVLGAPGAGRSWYEPERHRVVLGADEFMIFDDAAGPRLDPSIALLSLAHELAGHAVQDVVSRALPAPLRPDHRGRLRYASLPVAEGFASWRGGQLAVEFAEERGPEFGIDERGLALLRGTVALEALHHAVPAWLAVLSERTHHDPSFDAGAHATAVVGHTGFRERLVRSVAEQPLNKLFYDAACHFGRVAVHEQAATLAGHGVTGTRAATRLGCGGWTLGCYARAVTVDDA